jgi:transformation/transcription domain-associated protein
MILDTLHRLPFTPPEALQPYRNDVLELLMGLVRVENEENAVLCMKTIMDFQRNYQKLLQEQVQPFLDLIMDMFSQMPKAVKDTFDTSPSHSGATPGMPSTPNNQFQSPKPMSPLIPGSDPIGGDAQPAKMLIKGMQSFKVLAECPIIVVSLFQAHRNSVHKNVKLFVPLIKQMLQLQAQPQREAHEQAALRGENFTGVSPNIKNRNAFGEFITAQVKVCKLYLMSM